MKDCLAEDYWTTKKDHWTTEIRLCDERLIGRLTKVLISKDWRERLLGNLGDMTIGKRLRGTTIRRSTILGDKLRLLGEIWKDYWAKKIIGRRTKFCQKVRRPLSKRPLSDKMSLRKTIWGEGCSRERLFGNKRRHGFSHWNFVAIVHTSWVKCHVISCSVISCVRWDTRACVLRANILDFWLTVASNSVTQKTLFFVAQ